jgi:(p)ppGpp synthase/HD superfamily hydrolase
MINTAIEVALEAHKNQFRKGTKIPYVTHPLAVGIILAKAGFPDEVIAAGILHDTKTETFFRTHSGFEVRLKGSGGTKWPMKSRV